MTGFAEERSPAYVAPLSKGAFLSWVQDQQGRFELKDGRVIVQAGGTKKHGWICANFVRALGNVLDAPDWAVGTTDIAVEIGDDVRYPDVSVERRMDDGTALSTDRPVVLVEVLSPSSVGTDMTVKLAEYTSLASLEAYIVASQDEPILWVWQRSPETRAFPPVPTEIKGRDASLERAALAISLPLADLYRGVVSG